MINKALAIGAGFDWIGPLWTFIQDYRRRPAVRYNIPADCGWHAYAIQDMLQDSGIKLWGLALYRETYVFSVRKAQARYTQYLLERAGIPYYGGIDIRGSSPVSASQTQEAQQVSQPVTLDSYLDQIDGFVDSI